MIKNVFIYLLLLPLGACNTGKFSLQSVPGDSLSPGSSTYSGRLFADTISQGVYYLYSSNDQTELTERMEVDKNGNTFVIGRSLGTISGIPSTGAFDFFIVKYNYDRSIAWSKAFGSSSNDSPRGSAITSSGDIFVSGEIEGNLAPYTHDGVGGDLYVAKYSSSGNKIFDFSQGIGFDEGAQGVVVDSLGFMYLLIRSNAGSLYGVSPTAVGGDDCYLVKYDISDNDINPATDVIWTRAMGSTSQESCRDLAINGNDEIFVAVTNSSDFMGHTNQGGVDAYVLKYDSSGNLLWNHQIAGAGNDEIFSIDAENEFIAVAGPTNSDLFGKLHFDGGISQDIHTHVFNRSGQVIWTTLLGETGNEEAGEVEIDVSNGLVYITGFTDGAFAGHINQGSLDSYIAMLALSDGTVKDITFLAGTNIDVARDMAYCSEKNLLVTGGYYRSTDGHFIKPSGDTSNDIFIDWKQF